MIDERNVTEIHLSDCRHMKWCKRQLKNAITTESMSAVAWEQSVWVGGSGCELRMELQSQKDAFSYMQLKNAKQNKNQKNHTLKL